MPSGYVQLETRADVAALGTSEGIMSHGYVELGLKNLGLPLTFSEHVTLVHGGTHPLLYNLTLVAAGVPDWLLTLTIAPLPPAVPYIPGPGVFALIPGVPPVLPAGLPTLPVAPLDFFTAFATAALAGPGCFAFASNPGTVHQFQVSGTANPAAASGGHRYDFYVLASLTPGGPPTTPVAKIAIGMFVPGAA